MFTFGMLLATMKKLNLINLLSLALILWLSNIPVVFAVDLSGITPEDMQLFFNYLARAPAYIIGGLYFPIALYHAAVYLVSAVYSAFSR